MHIIILKFKCLKIVQRKVDRLISRRIETTPSCPNQAHGHVKYYNMESCQYKQ